MRANQDHDQEGAVSTKEANVGGVTTFPNQLTSPILTTHPHQTINTISQLTLFVHHFTGCLTLQSHAYFTGKFTLD